MKRLLSLVLMLGILCSFGGAFAAEANAVLHLPLRPMRMISCRSASPVTAVVGSRKRLRRGHGIGSIRGNVLARILTLTQWTTVGSGISPTHQDVQNVG